MGQDCRKYHEGGYVYACFHAAGAEKNKDAPGISGVRIIAVFCDLEKIARVGGTATVFLTCCTFTPDFAGIPGHPFFSI